MEKLIIEKIPEDIDEEKLLSSLPENIVQHCQSHKNRKSCLESLFAYSLLMENTKDQVISFREEKPDFMNSSLHFSLSHSGKMVAILLSDQKCGVDIQRRFDNLSLSRMILSEEEKEEYKLVNDKIEYLCRKWVLKEAYGKMTGEGLVKVMSKTIKEHGNIKTLMIDDVYYCAWFTE